MAALAAGFVSVDQLQSWGRPSDPEESSFDPLSARGRFLVSKRNNAKIYLWVGNIARLNVDAIVCPTNEVSVNLSRTQFIERYPPSARITAFYDCTELNVLGDSLFETTVV